MKIRYLLALIPVLLAGCVPTYTLRKAGPTTVAHNGFTVQPSSAWNVLPASTSRTRWEEVWTKNGPMLDTVAFLGGLPEGKSVVVQTKKAPKQVPLFRANMSPEDLVSLVEASYRIQGVTVFSVDAVDPVEFLGGQGIRVLFSYARGNGITKKGKSVLRVIDNKLFVMKLEGVSSHYFDAAVPEFDQLVASAAVRK
jgi:hypothetical protein